MRFIITVFLMFFASVAFGEDNMLQESVYTQVQHNIGKGKPTFLEVGSDSCHSCKVMSRMLYETTQKHPEYNIYFINVKKERDAASELKIMMIPTQIIYDKNGKEVYRHIGLLSDDELEKLFINYQFK
ncbi:thioredoxin family protein [Sulfurovum sp. zt1-1]|uniref:Thioredoxin family protein n=1 Tax=Sulfurovum zhangzhouensis TaxID=3019067 RepID=A0ABT7QY95_9BACT|nr:thioredoxin family protein [Sulfurovum zhangzhouensis]MDM5271741.1 thioredoxin family protein [Sulfurovum zhangzhouensis]